MMSNHLENLNCRFCSLIEPGTEDFQISINSYPSKPILIGSQEAPVGLSTASNLKYNTNTVQYKPHERGQWNSKHDHLGINQTNFLWEHPRLQLWWIATHIGSTQTRLLLDVDEHKSLPVFELKSGYTYPTQN